MCLTQISRLRKIRLPTIKKIGIYRIYMQSNYNIGLVMQLLNHYSEAMTLTYLGLNQASREIILD